MREDASEPFDPLTYENIAGSVVRTVLETEPQALAGIPRFEGAGIYALYYLGPPEMYAPIADPGCAVPIYAGSANPPGSRIGGDALSPEVRPVLHARLGEHRRSIDQAGNLEVDQFKCRYLRVRPVWIPVAEEMLIRRFRPVWNSVVDGFGNHPPGRGRRDMRRPRWDVVHPGRPWAMRLEPQEIIEQIKEHLARWPGKGT
ncbi:MAG: hypothetical protein AMK73_07565 [Planctomycetes bacterium SM23_32]|nr:MAG: hypothetical protein AMK73_07565 [Planctomycetes bacterium SM23_32]